MPPGAVPPGGYAYPPAVVPVPVAPNGARLASFGDRLGAYLLDSLVVAGIALVPYALCIAAFAMVVLSTTDPDNGPDPAVMILSYLGMLFLLIVIQLGAHYLYQVVYLTRKGRTIGKRVMKLDIVRASDGGPIDVRQARKRWLVQSVAGLAGIFSWLDGLWQLWDKPYQQCLHDKFADTIVVKVTG